jgi:hypothetical protein
LQSLFQPAQHYYEKWKDPEPDLHPDPYLRLMDPDADPEAWQKQKSLTVTAMYFFY